MVFTDSTEGLIYLISHPDWDLVLPWISALKSDNKDLDYVNNYDLYAHNFSVNESSDGSYMVYGILMGMRLNVVKVQNENYFDKVIYTNWSFLIRSFDFAKWLGYWNNALAEPGWQMEIWFHDKISAFEQVLYGTWILWCGSCRWGTRRIFTYIR